MSRFTSRLTLVLVFVEKALLKGRVKMSTHTVVPLFVVVAFASVGHPTHGQIVTNGSFESPAIPLATELSNVFPDGWSSLGNGSSVDIIHGHRGGVASDGLQFVDLIGRGLGETFPSGITQAVELDQGATYSLTFDYNGGLRNDGAMTIGSVLDYSLGDLVTGSINVDDLNAFAENGPVTPWQNVEATFTLGTPSGEYPLIFQTASGSFGSPYVDNVAINPVPEPSALPLLAAGALALMHRPSRRHR